MEEDNEDSGEGRGLQGHSNAGPEKKKQIKWFHLYKLLFVSDRQ